MKKKVLTFALAGIMAASLALTGCGKGGEGSDSKGDSGKAGDEGGKPYAGVTLKWWTGTTENNAGTQAVMEAATEKLGMEFEVEINPGGTEGDNILKTRMASGELPDFLVYNAGSKRHDLNPSRGFLDISDWDVVKKFDDAFLNSVTVDGKVYGAPQSST